jgi:hypothetical protein
MPMEHENELAEIGVRLTDDAYIAWHAAETECERAFRAWSHSGASNRAAAYCTYRAALDREEAAARDLKRLWVLTQPYRERLAGSRLDRGSFSVSRSEGCDRTI